jgi:hypothetical protein
MSTNGLTLNLDAEIKQMKETFGCEEWLTAYSHKKTDATDDIVFCAFIPNNKVEETLEYPTWVFPLSANRFSHDTIQPLIILRNFYRIKEDYIEISEEFRHYFNLYEKENGDSIKFYHINGNGDENEVATIEKNNVRIKLVFIKEFLAVKKMSLVIEYDFRRFSAKTLEEQKLQELELDVKGADHCYWHYIRQITYSEDHQSCSLLMGVKVIQGFPEPKSNSPFREDKNYEEYCIGFDKDGKANYFTCDEKKLSNQYGKNKGAPDYRTPVVFNSKVLSKYYAEPSKYSVEDGRISCGDLWHLYIDNDHSEHVIVFLGDLGSYLPYAEQCYWKSYNVETTGTNSTTSRKRNFEACPASPEKNDLLFKDRYQQVQKNWKEKMGWDLFLPLSSEDEHHFKTLRIPVSNEQKEFDEQVLSLTKLMIGSLNEAEFINGLSSSQKNVAGSINKFEKYIENREYPVKEMFKFLRDLQGLRSSGVAHCKGKEYSKIKKTFNIKDEEKQLSVIFNHILVNAIQVLDFIDYTVLKTAKRNGT